MVVRNPDIRLATLDDTRVILPLIQEFHRTSPYHEIVFDPVLAIQYISELLNRGVIILADEKSLIAGLVVQLPCSSSNVATETYWASIDVNVQRRTLALVSLHEAFEHWARDVAKAEFILTGSFHGTPFFTNRGYTPCEQVYLGKF